MTDRTCWPGIVLGSFIAGLCALLVVNPVAAVERGAQPFPGNRQRTAIDRSPTPAQIDALAALEAAATGEIEVRWDGETGSAAALSGAVARPFLGDASEAALDVLSRRAALVIPDPIAGGALLDPRTSPLRVLRVVERPRVDHVTLLQYRGDLVVHRGGYTVSMRRDPGPGGTVLRQAVSILGVYFPGIPESFDPEPALTGEEAFENALGQVAPGATTTAPPTTRLLIYPLNGAYHLAWQVDFPVRDPLARWRVFVDARSGEVLEAVDRIMYGNVTGTAWRRNPVQDPGGPVILPLRDAYVTRSGDTVVTDGAGDYDDAGAATVTTLLAGPYCIAFNEDVAEVSYSGPPDVFWNYPAWDTHFDEVNVFYHTNILHDYVRNTLNFSGASIQLPATVHVGNGFNNAYYDGAGIWFGDGDGVNYVDFTQDDVVYHEYGHYLFDRAISMGYGFNEVGGMNEGGADYFSCSFGDDPLLGEAVRVGGLIRNIDNKGFTPPRIYPDYLVDNGFEPHRGGEVWGGALWDIRKVLGATVTDRVAFEGLFYMPPNPGFLDGRAGVVQADIDNYLGIHKLVIEQLMFERGIGPPPSTDPFVRILAEPSIGVAPLPVVFTGVAVDDGMIVSYLWDFGDGVTDLSTNPVITHLYTADGIYTVTLIVTDDTGATASWSIAIEAMPPGEIVLTPQEMDIGFVRSDRPTGNFFGDDDVYAGYLSGFDYHGAALFRLPFVPGGSSNLLFDSASLEFTGQDASAKGPTGGIWSVRMLTADVDAGWNSHGYNRIVNARSLFTLGPALSNGDLVPRTTNVFSVSSTQLPALHDRIAVGSISFRVDGPYGADNLFSWDSGYDRFGEDPAATRVKPVLRIPYRLIRQMGDLNRDGSVNGTDARLVAEGVVGVRTLSADDEVVADVDRNGVVDERDAAAILAKAAGLIDF